ncbi:MAG: hypothetical protein B6243_05980 [Anaerolineaceae bacterium 4572_5.2]|nr:MAG: hypothetical protein B6243_05980 [Anaerolineaceae bacterium 4572_5.2]
MNREWDQPSKRTAAIILGIFFIYLIYLSRSVIPFLVIAALIAFILIPAVSFFQKKLRLPKAVAVILAYLLLFLALLLIPLLLIPALVDAFGDINIDLVAITQQTQGWLNALLKTYRFIIILNSVYDLSPIVDPALEMVNDFNPTQFIPSLDTIIASIPSTVEFTWGVASNVVGRITASILAIVLTLLYSVYLTVDGDKFVRGAINLAPKTYRPEIITLYHRIKTTWGAYFRGQFTLGLIIGMVTWIGGLIIGIPGALALGVIAGVMEILPNLGPILAAIPALLVALVQGSTTLDVSNLTFMLIVGGMYILIQQLENNLIVPKVLGEAVELHPLVVMVGVVVGASVGGILGALLAAPTIAMGRTIVSYIYAKILGEDPFPPPSKPPKPTTPFSERLRLLWNKLKPKDEGGGVKDEK